MRGKPSPRVDFRMDPDVASTNGPADVPLMLTPSGSVLTTTRRTALTCIGQD